MLCVPICNTPLDGKTIPLFVVRTKVLPWVFCPWHTLLGERDESTRRREEVLAHPLLKVLLAPMLEGTKLASGKGPWFSYRLYRVLHLVPEEVPQITG